MSLRTRSFIMRKPFSSSGDNDIVDEVITKKLAQVKFVLGFRSSGPTIPQNDPKMHPFAIALTR